MACRTPSNGGRLHAIRLRPNVIMVLAPLKDHDILVKIMSEVFFVLRLATLVNPKVVNPSLLVIRPVEGLAAHGTSNRAVVVEHVSHRHTASVAGLEARPQCPLSNS